MACPPTCPGRSSTTTPCRRRGHRGHPTQLYEALGLFGIGAALSFQEGRKRFAGQITLGYLGSYAILRMVTELFRGDAERRFVPIVGLSTSQAISVVILLGAAWAWRNRVASLTEERVSS